jgi:hypothetical protein
MKNFLVVACLLLSSLTGFAKKYVPQIATGTVLNYTAYARAFGKACRPLLLSPI